MADYQRPPGNRFKFGGLNLRSQPDALAPDKYSVALNIRALSDNSIQTRPGYTILFTTAGGQPITDIRAYTALNTDNLPRYLVRDAVNKIYLDTGALVTTLAAPGPSSGASMIPFRPASSPQPWMYITSTADYQKVSSPDAFNACIAQKVGIAEPQISCEAAPFERSFTELNIDAGVWVNTGTAAAPANANVSALTNTVQATPLGDPQTPQRFSVAVGATDLWNIGMVVDISAHGGLHGIIQDYIQPIPLTAGLTIAAIRYYAGTTGRCTIVLSPVETGETGFISGFKRGALARLDTSGGGDETVFVLSVTAASDGGTVSFECVTANTQTVGKTVTLRRTIIVDGLSGTFTGDTIGVNMLTSVVSSGTGLLSQTLSSSPFSDAFGVFGGGGSSLPRQDDYIHLTFQINSPALLTSIKIVFNVGPSTPDYKSNIFYYNIAGVPLAAISNIGALWELTIPVSALTDAGGGANLSAVNGVQIQFQVSGSTTCAFGGFTISGGGLPDVGETGIPYRYRVVPRSSLTGAVGNPCPDMRYGVSPRRQGVTVALPSAAYDSQIDTWDIYRYGGSITSFRYIGSTPSSSSTFSDNVFDDTGIAGKLLEVDNFEPWPTIDVPFKAPGGATLVIVGTFVTLSGVAAGLWPATILAWLPGTLIGTGGFTLRSRPIKLSSTSYRFEVVEEVGTGAYFGSFMVSEPNVARQILPFLWGPDANGVVFGVGDPLRPGTIYFSKPFNPDSAPDINTIELAPPSEPLLGGELRDGLAYVYSAMRWWALYPNFGGTIPYTQVERPVGKPPTTPFGSVTDGALLYFWSKEGICITDGGAAVSLTDEDLYPLFPHDAVPGLDVTRNGVTVSAPGYQYIAAFRLCRAGVYLYADFKDSSGVNRGTLVYDTRSKAWSWDVYADIMTVHYAPEQTEGTLGMGSPAIYPLMLMADNFGNVYKQTDISTDNAHQIPCKVGVLEWDGGDLRALPQWGDAYVDLLAHVDVTCTPVSQQVAVAPATLIPLNAARQFVTVSLGGEIFLKFLGLLFEWTDFSLDSAKTTLYIWQQSLLSQPETTIDRIEDWDAAGSPGAKYFRGFVLTADTFGNPKMLGVQNGDNAVVDQVFTCIHAGEQGVGYAFSVPFVAHWVRLVPKDTQPWRKFGIRWICDEWPELTQELSAWIDMGSRGAKYFRGGTVCIDTNGFPIHIKVKSSDTNVLTELLPFTGALPFNTPAGEKTEVAFAISATVPFVGHEFQFVPSGPCRIWWNEAVFHVDPWPEMTQESSAWMDMGSRGAKYFRGGTVCIDTDGHDVLLAIRSSDGGTTNLGTFNTTAGLKAEIAFAVAQPTASGPFVGHEFQFFPSAPCRIWWNEAVFHVDPYPEITREWTPVLELTGADDKYVRAIRITADSAGLPVNFQLLVNNISHSVIGPLSFIGKMVQAWAFDPPFVGHTMQLVPDAAVRIFVSECKWDTEVYPELIAEYTPIMEYGGPDNKYFRGIRITGDSANIPVSFQVLVEGNQTGQIIGPLKFNGKQTVAWAFRPPFIAHNVQLKPLFPCRIWVDLSMWDSDPYPELIPEYTSILELGGPDSKYIQGIKVTGDTQKSLPLSTINDQFVQLQIVFDGGQIGPMLEPRAWNGKSVQVFSFPPFVAHSVQIIPQQAIRIWVPESEWVWEETPELAVEWGPTQWTAHGMTGYHHIQRIEAAYASTTPVALTITSFDGTSPQPVILPPTGGVYQKTLITLTYNKGQLYQYSAISAGKFQIWLNDWKIYVGAWGRSDPYTLYQNLGGAYGDKARI